MNCPVKDLLHALRCPFLPTFIVKNLNTWKSRNSFIVTCNPCTYQLDPIIYIIPCQLYCLSFHPSIHLIFFFLLILQLVYICTLILKFFSMRIINKIASFWVKTYVQWNAQILSISLIKCNKCRNLCNPNCCSSIEHPITRESSIM